MVLDTICILLQFSVRILGVPLPLGVDTPQVSDMAGQHSLFQSQLTLAQVGTPL